MLNKGYDKRQLVDLFFPINTRRRIKVQKSHKEKNKQAQEEEANKGEGSARNDYALSLSEFNDVLAVDLGVLLRFVSMLHIG